MKWTLHRGTVVQSLLRFKVKGSRFEPQTAPERRKSDVLLDLEPI